VRLISATNRDLKARAAAGAFREDLYYRLAIVPLSLPPLRARPGDVALLARHFLEKHAGRMGRRLAGFEPEAEALLSRHAWPGNVRELENAVQQAMVFAEGERIRAEDLPASLRDAPAALPVPTGERPLPEILDDLERQLVADAMARARGVKAEAARLLGVKPSALYYKLEKYGLGGGEG
jgi:two-component system response regulator HydG